MASRLWTLLSLPCHVVWRDMFESHFNNKFKTIDEKAVTAVHRCYHEFPECVVSSYLFFVLSKKLFFFACWIAYYGMQQILRTSVSLVLINFAVYRFGRLASGLEPIALQKKKTGKLFKISVSTFRYPNMEIDMEATKVEVLKHSLKKLYLPLHISATWK